MPNVMQRRALLLVIGLGLAATVAWAGKSSRGAAAAPADKASSPREAISEDAAVALVREMTGGKVIRCEPRMNGGQLVYVVRVMLPAGRVRDYKVDAATGAVH